MSLALCALSSKVLGGRSYELSESVHVVGRLKYYEYLFVLVDVVSLVGCAPCDEDDDTNVCTTLVYTVK